MIIKYTFLCDYASVDAGGKVSANGLFEIIHAPSFPVMQPVMFLVTHLEGTVHEKGTHKFTIEWRDDKQDKLNSFDRPIELKSPGVIHGTVSANIVFDFRGLVFHKAGVNEFVVFVDDRFLARVVFAVKKAPGET